MDILAYMDLWVKENSKLKQKSQQKVVVAS